MNHFMHIVRFLDQSRNYTYLNRRENEGLEIYKTMKGGFYFFESSKINYPTIHSDKILYDSLYTLLHINEENKNNIENTIKHYNEWLRTGCELFLYEEIKNYLLNNFKKIE